MTSEQRAIRCRHYWRGHCRHRHRDGAGSSFRPFAGDSRGGETLAAHQSGHNSGVIHSGLYYKPGSLKARNCVQGRQEMYRFCQEHGVPHERCGKLVIATHESELPALEELERRGVANGLEGIRRLGPEEIRELEPHAAGIAGLHVPDTGIVDYAEVTRRFADIAQKSGGQILTGARVLAFRRLGGEFVLETARQEIRCRHLVNCGAPKRPRRPPLRRRARAADHSVSRRILLLASRPTLARPEPDLSRARPAVPLLGRPLHAHDPWRRRGRPQCRPCSQARGIPPRERLSTRYRALGYLRRILAHGPQILEDGARRVLSVGEQAGIRQGAPAIDPGITARGLGARRRRRSRSGRRSQRRSHRRFPNRWRRPDDPRAERAVSGGNRIDQHRHDDCPHGRREL